MLNPSGESFDIDFLPGGPDRILQVDFFADYCYRINTEASPF